MRTTVNDSGLKNSLAVSASLHVLFLLFLYFGLPTLFKPLPSYHPQVSFEIVEIAELTNTRVATPEEQQQPPAPPPAPAPKEQAAPAPQPIKPPEKVESIALPKPAEKPKPPQDAKPKEDNFNKLLRDISKLKPQDKAQPTEAKTDSKQASDQKSLAPSLSDRLTITQEDALRRQIEGCWSPPIGARDAKNLVVDITIDVNPDRTVSSVEIVDKSRYATDNFFRAAADAAVRAVRNPRCSPLEVPADKYEQWKRIDFTFDPRDAL